MACAKHTISLEFNTLKAYWEKFLSTTFRRMHCKLPELTKDSFKNWIIHPNILNSLKRKHGEAVALQ